MSKEMTLEIPEDLRELYESDAVWDGGLMVRFAKASGISMPWPKDPNAMVRNVLIERIARLEQDLSAAKAEIVRTKKDHDDAIKRLYLRESENWKRVCASDVYQDLKHGAYRDIMGLLSDGEISIGKAAEAIAERSGGIEPFLPDWNPPEQDADLSWRERHDKSVARLTAQVDALETPFTYSECEQSHVIADFVFKDGIDELVNCVDNANRYLSRRLKINAELAALLAAAQGGKNGRE